MVFAVHLSISVMAGFTAVDEASVWLFSGIAAIITAASIYAYTAFYLWRKIKPVEELLDALIAKEFDSVSVPKHSGGDEVGVLLNKAGEASEAVEQEFARLFRLENYRKDFIGDISHELKTPIFAIQGFVETLLDGALEDEKVNRHFLRKTMKNVNRLTILTNDLMEIAKLETGELKSYIQPVYLSDMVHELQDMLAHRAAEERVELDFRISDEKIRVMSDRNQMRQVLVNLIENGIKYNKPGGKVTLSITDSKASPGKVQVKVKDTGIGISEDHLGRVTERFFRVDKSRSRDKGGTGLGLAIVKHILESHGSSLKVKSRLNEGSEFSFCLKKA